MLNISLNKFYLWRGAIVAFAMLSLTGCKPQDPDVVGQVNNTITINFDELKQFFEEKYFYKKYDTKTIKDYEIALNDMLVNRAKLMDFFDSGFDQDTLLMSNIRRTINEELVFRYYESQYLDKYVNDEAIEDLYSQLKREVTYSLIIIPKQENISAEDSTEQIVVHIQTALKNGENFAELAKKYSSHPSSAEGGRMPALTWKGNPDEFSRRIFLMKSGDMQTFETDNSYQFVKIEKVSNIPIGPLEEIKHAIIEQLKNDYTDRALSEYDHEFKQSLDTSTIQWNDETLTQLVSWVDPGGFNIQSFSSALENAINQGNNLSIAAYPDGSLRLKSFQKLLEDILSLSSNNVPTEEDFKNYIIEALRIEQIVNRAKALDLEKEILNVATADDVLHKSLIQLYDRKIIELNMPDVTEDVLHTFYTENMDSLYFQFPKVNIYAAITNEKAKAEELLQKLDEGVKFEKLMRRIFVKTFIMDHDSIIHSFFSREKPYLGEAAFSLELNGVDGPIEYTDPEKGVQFAIIKCVNKTQPRQLDYAEVKNRIEDDYLKYERERILKENAIGLKKKYDLRIFRDVLAQKLKEV